MAQRQIISAIEVADSTAKVNLVTSLIAIYFNFSGV